MTRLLAATAVAALLLTVPAKADIILDTTGIGGTGNNVIFSSIANSGLILGRLNGQNDEVVRFLDRSAFNPDGGILAGLFSGAANGNDIKIVNTSELDITVFDRNNLTQLTTTRDIFSIVGTGTLLIRATALEADGTFKDFLFSSVLSNGQNGFDLKAINGERIWDVDFRVVGGSITDFEHFRIDVAPGVTAVPGPIAGAGLPGLIAACGALYGFGVRRRRKVAHS
jgi:hypothetical protein